MHIFQIVKKNLIMYQILCAIRIFQFLIGNEEFQIEYKNSLWVYQNSTANYQFQMLNNQFKIGI